MEHWTDHNCSVTISYSPDEVPEMVKWILQNWNSYVGVSFLLRNDPTKTAQQLGFPYLPQEVTTREAYEEYARQLKPFDLDTSGQMVDDLGEDCSTGSCPIR